MFGLKAGDLNLNRFSGKRGVLFEGDLADRLRIN